MDGVCIGHPRCNVELCTQRLQSPRDRFCEAHQSYERLCAIVGCKQPCEDGKRTCRIQSHRSYEEAKEQRGQAIYRLRRRLPREQLSTVIRSLGDGSGESDGQDPHLNVLDVGEVAQELNAEEDSQSGQGDSEVTAPIPSTHPTTSLPLVNSSTPPENDPSIAPSAKGGRPTLKSVLTRRWTHNEQLMVRPCGIVIARATFYEAESVSNAVVSSMLSPGVHV